MNRNKNGRFTAVKKEEKENTLLTLSEAVTQLKSFDPKINKTKLRKIIANPKWGSIFTSDTVKITHFHPEVEDLVQIEQSALDAYQGAKTEKLTGHRATRAGRDRKWIVYIPDARIEEYRSLTERAGFNAPVAAYKVSKKTNAPVPQDTAAPTDLVEELITA